MTRSRRAGFALADFLAGTLILAGAVGAWAALTRGQIDLAATADRRSRALYAADEALSAFRARPDAQARAKQVAPADGNWTELERFDVPALLAIDAKEKVGRLDVRRVTAKATGFEAAPAPVAFEVRARLEWRGESQAPDRLWISTVIVEKAE